MIHPYHDALFVVPNSSNNPLNVLHFPSPKGLGMAFSQQSVGVAAPMFFGTYILERSGMAMELAMDANVSIGVVAVVAMAFGLWISRPGLYPLVYNPQR